MFTAMIRPFSVLSKNRELLKVMTVRLWLSRGKGGLFHLLWPLITPVILLSIYYFAFGIILGLRNQSAGSNYALELFCGMAVFNVFAETLNASAFSLTSQAGLVKKAVFDLEVIPLSTVGCAVISGLIYQAVIFCAAVFCCGVGPGIMKLPFLLLSFVLFCSGCALFVSSISVFISDLAMLIPLLTQALFFLTPIIYPYEKVKATTLHAVVDLNPLTGFVCAIRSTLLNAADVPWTKTLILFALGLGCYILGYCFFAKTKKGFPDVL